MVEMLIVVTGFGPFFGLEVNPSWEAVKRLPAVWDDEDHQVVVEEIPVEYDFVLREVPSKWSHHKPDFIIHVGAGGPSKLILESKASNCGYYIPDTKTLLPPNNCCVPSYPLSNLTTCLDLQDLSEKVTAQSSHLGVQAEVSQNAGKYLCEFVYFKSLHATSGRSLFIHVPMVDKPHSIQQITEGLKSVIKNIIKQLQSQASP